jgi:phasin family protein
MTTANTLGQVGTAAAETAARATRISLDSAERAIAVQLEYAKGAVEQAAINAKVMSQVKDMQGLMSLPSRLAETALENMMGYSRSLYEIASEAQSEYSRLAEERMAAFQAVMAETVDQAAKSAPAGGDVAVAALKSQMAATTAAFDSFTKAAKNFASYADAGVKAASSGKRK